MVRYKTLGLALGLAVFVLGAPRPASAENKLIKGKVANYRSLSNPVWDEARDPKKHGFSFREPVPTVRSEFRHLFPHIPKELCIVALADSKQAPQKTPILIRVGGGRTTPVTIVVPPGTQLQFKNTDPFKHRLFAVDQPTFQPSDVIKGAHRDWLVRDQGSFEIRDEAAPSLRMWVVSDPKVAAIAYPSLKGDFALSVPGEGAYTVQAYFAGKKVGPAVPVEVKGGTVELKAPIKVAADPKKAPAKADDKEDKDKSK